MSFHYHLRYRDGIWKTLTEAEYGEEIYAAIMRVMNWPQTYFIMRDGQVL